MHSQGRLIGCSPQEIIANSLFNCYSDIQQNKHLVSMKSFSKDKMCLHSPRKNQKISLKKTTSLKYFYNKPGLVIQKPIVIESPKPKQVYFQAPLNKLVMKQKQIQNRNKNTVSHINNQQVVRISYSNQIVQKTCNQTQQNKYGTYNFDILKGNTQLSEISRAQTLHSFRSFQIIKKKQQKDIQQNENRKIQLVCQRQQTQNFAADKQSPRILKTLLKLINLKETESIWGSSHEFQDSFSEVISEYFPHNKFRLQKQNT